MVHNRQGLGVPGLSFLACPRPFPGSRDEDRILSYTISLLATYNFQTSHLAAIYSRSAICTVESMINRRPRGDLYRGCGAEEFRGQQEIGEMRRQHLECPKNSAYSSPSLEHGIIRGFCYVEAVEPQLCGSLAMVKSMRLAVTIC